MPCVVTISSQLHAAPALLYAEVNTEGEVQRLQGGPAIQPGLLSVNNKLPQTLVDDGVEECEVMEPDGSAEDKLKQENQPMPVL